MGSSLFGKAPSELTYKLPDQDDSAGVIQLLGNHRTELLTWEVVLGKLLTRSKRVDNTDLLRQDLPNFQSGNSQRFFFLMRLLQPCFLISCNFSWGRGDYKKMNSDHFPLQTAGFAGLPASCAQEISWQFLARRPRMAGLLQQKRAGIITDQQ